MPQPTLRLARKVTFSSAHRYFNPAFSEDENKRIFGMCYTPYGHGHNYVLEAYFEGPVDPQTGMVINLRDVDLILKDVLKPLDHHHLNFDVPEFKSAVPTTENIAKYCFDRIAEKLVGTPVRLSQVRLFEGDDLWVDCYG
ncbi:MAG TPA: 6-carboxytetrahydropterin synthase [Bdellovibrionales bacterium]|nr:6-carboxytetrahydropterin synthase [Bdellovibrionales bacterium]